MQNVVIVLVVGSLFQNYFLKTSRKNAQHNPLQFTEIIRLVILLVYK